MTLPDGSPYTYHVNSSMPVMKMFAEATAAAGIGSGAWGGVDATTHVRLPVCALRAARCPLLTFLLLRSTCLLCRLLLFFDQ